MVGSSSITKTLETRLTNFLLDLWKKKIIDDSTYWNIKPCGSRPGVLYGLPNVHKARCPMRPIVSSIDTYNHKLAKYLVKILKPISSNKFCIKDTLSFVDWIKQQTHNNNYMCSFDVNSLVTNVPLYETINISIDKLYRSPNPPNLPKEVGRTLLQSATKQSHFIFDGKYYDQIDGVAMGSPLGPILANIFMCSFQKRFINTYKTPNSILTWYRHVYDHFCLFNNKHSVSTYLIHHI